MPLEILLHIVVYIIIGGMAGLMSGILGVGGGIVVVPGLTFLFQFSHLIPDTMSMQVAAGSSLAVMIFTSQASLRAHYKLGEILWPIYNRLWLGLVIGTIIGGIPTVFIPTRWLEIIFACFLFFVAIKKLVESDKIHNEHVIKVWVDRIISIFIGVVSGLLGIGGGVLIVPYLSLCGISARKIAPVSNLCTLTVGLTGTLIFIITGWAETKAISYTIGYIYWPAVLGVAIPSVLIAPWGAKLNYIVPVKLLKYFFIVILIITAMKLLF